MPRMKTIYLLMLLGILPVWGEDWTTTDGKTYQGVKVLKVESDAVTILDKDGGGRIELAKLSPELQKKFQYDPVKAKAAANERAQEEADNAQALADEQDQAAALKRDKLIQEENDRQQTMREYAASHPEGYHSVMATYRQRPSFSRDGDTISATPVYSSRPQAAQRPGMTAEDLSWQRYWDKEKVVKKDDEANNYAHTSARVMQVLPDGFIGNFATRWGIYDPGFIKCDSSGMVDGQSWNGIIVPDKTFKYTNGFGELATIPAFTTDLRKKGSVAVQSNFIPPRRPVSSMMSVGGG